MKYFKSFSAAQIEETFRRLSSNYDWRFGGVVDKVDSLYESKIENENSTSEELDNLTVLVVSSDLFIQHENSNKQGDMLRFSNSVNLDNSARILQFQFAVLTPKISSFGGFNTLPNVTEFFSVYSAEEKDTVRVNVGNVSMKVEETRIFYIMEAFINLNYNFLT